MSKPIQPLHGGVVGASAVHALDIHATDPRSRSVGPQASTGASSAIEGLASAKGAADAKRKAGIHKAATEFESIFVRQLLTAAKIGGAKGGGYGSMAVDALASGIQSGGGMGLAGAIEKALDGSHADQTNAPKGLNGVGK
jgi:Rod binding domain-containing protein